MSQDVAFEVGRLYGPIKAIADAITATQHGAIDVLPGLAGYFLGGTRDGNGNLLPHGTLGSMQETGSCPSGFDGKSYCKIGDGVNYLFTASIFANIDGTETWIEANIRGLSFGCWVHAVSLPNSNNALLSKDGGATDRQYGAYETSGNTFNFYVSDTGADLTSAQVGGVQTGTWQFCAGRWIPSVEVAVFLENVKVVNTTAVPASLYSSTQNFEVGRFFGADSSVGDFRFRDLFVCAAALTDEQFRIVRASTAP